MGTIENKLCSYYNLGFPNSSNFMELKRCGNRITYICHKKAVFRAILVLIEKKDSESYLVSVSSVSVKHSKR